MFGDNVIRCWKQIIYFGGENTEEKVGSGETKPMVTKAFEDLIDDDQKLVSDGRGVRLARDEDEDGD